MAVTMRDATPDVDSWVHTSMALIEAASAYAEGGQYDPDADGKIRRIRVVASALQSALQNVNIIPSPIVPSPVSTATPMPSEAPAPEAPPAEAPRAGPRRAPPS